MTKWRCGYDTRNWPVTHPCKALTHSGSPPQPFDSTNSRQTALVGSKVLCYLLDTIYVPLQLDLCCINKKSVKDNKKSAENLNAFAATGHTVVYASQCRFCAFDTMHFKYRPDLL